MIDNSDFGIELSYSNCIVVAIADCIKHLLRVIYMLYAFGKTKSNKFICTLEHLMIYHASSP